MTDLYAIDERREALAQWADVVPSAINHIEGYEFTTPSAVYYVLDNEEANTVATEEAEQDYDRLCEDIGNARGPATMRAAESDYWRGVGIAGRGTQIAIDTHEHSVGEWFIYKVATR